MHTLMTHKQHAHIMVLLQWEISLARYNNLRVVKRPVWTPVCAKGLEDNSRSLLGNNDTCQRKRASGNDHRVYIKRCY